MTDHSRRHRRSSEEEDALREIKASIERRRQRADVMPSVVAVVIAGLITLYLVVKIALGDGTLELWLGLLATVAMGAVFAWDAWREHRG